MRYVAWSANMHDGVPLDFELEAGGYNIGAYVIKRFVNILA